MTFAENLKKLRKQNHFSQEQLATKLNVSRQAITKWETGAGFPDIENLISISSAFNISIDELIGNLKEDISKDFLYESVTEYDIDQVKRLDMKLGGAKQCVLSGYQGEKIRVRLTSDSYSTLQNDFKVKIDDIRNRIDVDMNLKNSACESISKEEIYIFIEIPVSYIQHIECDIHANEVIIQSLDCSNLELDIKSSHVLLKEVTGNVEINCNLDMEVLCPSFKGDLSFNQLSSTSKLYIPENLKFSTHTKGIGNHILFENNALQQNLENCETVIELNGLKSELMICSLKEENYESL
ncbi:helix-turn-helix domain-containing protein [Floccifex sp.]|uniref:helix-turn-helix domain-containing protein n=1 Tax=Floccifex sp. TaxID=2815810 RepID=UPI003F122960